MQLYYKSYSFTVFKVTIYSSFQSLMHWYLILHPFLPFSDLACLSFYFVWIYTNMHSSYWWFVTVILYSCCLIDSIFMLMPKCFIFLYYISKEIVYLKDGWSVHWIFPENSACFNIRSITWQICTDYVFQYAGFQVHCNGSWARCPGCWFNFPGKHTRNCLIQS